MSEIELHRMSMAEQMEFARAVAHRPEGGAASLLPDAYRANPGNILIAVGLGQSMGLSPAESLYRISVIKGKPSASAELIAANVRKAGHKLRVRVTEDPPSATCIIVRADDPDEPTSVTRDMKWAQQMGLASEPNYRKQPATMLSWRAISACARLACPEALYGVTYTPDEIESSWDGTTTPPRQSGLAAALAPTISDAGGAPDDAANVIGSEPSTPASKSPVDAELVEEPITDKSRREMFALFTEKGIAEDQQLAGINHRLGTAYESRGDLTEPDAREVIAYLRTLPSVGATS